VSAPALWIAVPLIIGGLGLFLLSERGAASAGGVVCLILAGIAMAIPIDEALAVGPFSLKIAATATLLGRSFILPRTDAPLLAFLFGLTGIWFFGAEAAGVARRLVPAGLIITGLLIASLAVQPFLYAALLIEMAALAAVPLVAQQGQPPGKAVIKFLVYQTLGMPCILLAGWMLAGVEASPGDLALTIQATAMLCVGFAFLLAVFPVNDWIPGLMEQGHPYVSGFLLWLMPTAIIVFGLNFLDGYAWLRASPLIITGLRVLGLIMLVTSGVWSALETNLGRIMGHATVAESGIILVAASLATSGGVDLIFPFFVPRGIAMLLWARALTVAAERGDGLDLSNLPALGREHPWAGVGIALAGLSAAGFPLLAGFPPRIDVWYALARTSGPSALWFLVGLAGLMVCATRLVSALLAKREEQQPPVQDNGMQKGFLGAAIVALLLLGLFPKTMNFLVTKLPLMFEHLAH
jgi:NADH:ubiquinone oxidoreductase subunit 2 (subunit N)